MTAGTIYFHDHPDSLRYAVRGPLDAALARELAASAAIAESIRQGRPVVIDLRQATVILPEAAALIARLAGPQTRLRTREENLAPLAGMLARAAQPAPEPRRPWLLRWWCALLERLGPGCACPACQSGRIWSL